MNALLQTKIDTVAFGTQVLKRDLFLIEQGHRGWDRTVQENTVEQLVRRVMQLELDVTALMAQCLSVGFRYPLGRTSQILDGLWGVFLILASMYADLTMPNKDANGLGVHPSKLKELQVSWVRLNKLTKQARDRLAEDKLLATGKAVH
jgi:hypothetical protein